jgi:hypothetical protein
VIHRRELPRERFGWDKKTELPNEKRRRIPLTMGIKTFTVFNFADKIQVKDSKNIKSAVMAKA